MKILIIAATPYFSNRGCHIRIFLGAKYLQKKGVDVLLCTYHLGENVGDFPIKTNGHTSWYKKTSPGFAWGKLWLDVKLLWLCIREIRRFKPDAIHAHLFEGLAIGYLAKIFAGKFGIPIVIDSQGDIEAEFNAYNKKNKFAKKVFVPLAKRIIRLADYIVLSSENALPFFEKIAKLKNKISVIKDGVGIEFFKESGQEKLSESVILELEQVGEWKKNGKLLIYTGGMEDSKGVESLLKEFLVIKDELRDWKLLLYGVGSDRKAYRRLIEEYHASEQVRFTKETSFFVLSNFLKIADVAIDPKEESTEGSGKLMNYMAVGLPIVCFENNFNKQKLGSKGFYLQKMSDLGNSLRQDFPEKISYNLQDEIEKGEIEKLFNIFTKLIEKRKHR
ncbi:glycosyltransferase [bacterium]|jgi:glycosyltransferase involved in cell wall biosynthesis|nr:glycosyltransferase [bacterium]MBT4251257.1 glycosyltransferase [bacterium]MBT4598362.1 glycosyltransferase [bacterium]MBT6754195.1 glycosyltransferase [bacterium]MBT7038034.1 glycosyltransferase [bacterium]